jgi:HSP20 family molecular chaperone IbpA
MATQQNVTQDPEKGTPARQATQRNESAMRPPVDVYETSDGIKLIADMPGVSKEHLRLQAEGNTLTIEGELQFEMADRMEALAPVGVAPRGPPA